MDIDDFLIYGTTSGDDCVPDDDAIDDEIPQKEIYCNKYLPYADQLDDESQKMLTELKEGLAKAVAPGRNDTRRWHGNFKTFGVRKFSIQTFLFFHILSIRIGQSKLFICIILVTSNCMG